MSTCLEELVARDLIDRARAIAREYHVSVDDIGSPSRLEAICRARDHFAYVLVDELRWSYPQAGRLLRRDHTSIMQSVRRFALACGDVTYSAPKSLTRVRTRERDRGAA